MAKYGLTFNEVQVITTLGRRRLYGAEFLNHGPKGTWYNPPYYTLRNMREMGLLDWSWEGAKRFHWVTSHGFDALKAWTEYQGHLEHGTHHAKAYAEEMGKKETSVRRR